MFPDGPLKGRDASLGHGGLRSAANDSTTAMPNAVITE
jgi:hypothetical protein